MGVRGAFLGTVGSAVAGLVAARTDPVDAFAAAFSAPLPFVATSKYKLKCWEAADDTPTTFCKGPGQLFFSKKLFKWKDLVPGQK